MTPKGKEHPTISVLLPVYNAEAYLREAVKSILAQTFSDFELLIIDDGSTDTSFEILNEFSKRDSRITLTSRENKGLVATLNALVAKASGRYLARMDADDICLPDRFAKQVAFLDDHPGYVVAGAWVEQITDKGLPIGILKPPVFHEDIDQNNLQGHTSICHPVAMIRREAMHLVQGYGDEYDAAQDLDLWLRLAEIGKLTNIPEVLLKFRLTDNSISVRNAEIQQRCMIRACEQAWRRRGVESGEFAPLGHWRPGSDRASRHTYAVRYGWIAWQHGNRKTWWFFVRKALCLRPFSFSSWRLFIFGLLKKPKSTRESGR